MLLIFENALFLVITAIFALPSIKISKRNDFVNQPFSLEMTNSMKGLIALFVLFHHIANKFPETFSPFKMVGGLLVGIFLMYSGYGLYYGLKNKDGYLNTFIQKRIGVILIPYFIVLIIKIIIKAFIGTRIGIKDLLLSIIGFKLIDVTDWYVYSILFLYFAFFISFKIFKSNEKLAFTFMMVLNLIYIAIILKTGIQPTYLRNMLSFFAGMIISKYFNSITSFVKKHFTVFFIAMMFITLLFYVLGDKTVLNNIAYTISSIGFIFFIVAFSQKVIIKNPIITLLGKCSFELYLIHSVLLELFEKKIVISNKMIYIVVSIIVSLIFAYVLNAINSLVKKQYLKFIK